MRKDSGRDRLVETNSQVPCHQFGAEITGIVSTYCADVNTKIHDSYFGASSQHTRTAETAISLAKVI